MGVDPTGTFVLSAILIGLMAGAAVGAVVGGTVAGVVAYNNGARGGELFGWIMLGIVGGAAIGGAIGAAIGAAAPAIGSAATSISNFLGSTLFSASFAFAGGGSVTISVTYGQAIALASVLALGANIVFSKHDPGMSNKPPVSWTNIDEGLEIYNMFGGNSNKAAEYLLNQFRGPGNWSKGAKSEFNALKKWFDRIIRLWRK